MAEDDEDYYLFPKRDINGKYFFGHVFLTGGNFAYTS